MSTLTVSNVSDGSLSIPTTYVTNGSAKAWVNLNGTGTIAARDSLNLSSLTDNGTGDYTVNFTSAFGAADYAPTFSNIPINSFSDTRPVVANIAGAYNSGATAMLTGSLKLCVAGIGAISQPLDTVIVCASINGDLA